MTGRAYTGYLPATGVGTVKLSARNQIKGTITEVIKGQTTGHVHIDIGNGVTVHCSITNEAIDGPGAEGGRRGLGGHQGVGRDGGRRGVGAAVSRGRTRST